MSDHFVAVLAHFCELHGPSTILCTQGLPSVLRELLMLTPSTKLLLQTCVSCKLILPDESANLETTDENEQFSYISTQYPASQQLYSALTKLSTKTLSVETTSDLSKPIFFGDTLNGYCISKLFKIPDINARGGERKYSLMVACDNERLLLLRWDTVSVYFQELISYIQQLVTKQEAQKESKSKEPSNDNEMYLRRSLIKPKSLIDLTGDDQLFVKLHLLAMELLRDIQA